MQPPQNPSPSPYEQPNLPPQPNPYLPPNPYGVLPEPLSRPPRGKVSLEVIGDSWKLVSPNIGNWILLMLLIFAVYMGMSFIANMIQMPFIFATASRGGPPGSGIPGELVVGTAVAMILNFIAQTWLIGGIIRVAFDSLRTGRLEIGKLFSATNVLGRLLVGTILMALVYVIVCIPGEYFLIKGYIALFKSPIMAGSTMAPTPGAVPITEVRQISLGYSLLLFCGLLCMGFCMTQPLIVEKGLGPVEALMTSWKGLQKHLFMLIVFGLVTYLLNIVGMAACCIGLFVTVPITIISFALIYRDIFGLDNVMPEMTSYTGAPISDPQR